MSTSTYATPIDDQIAWREAVLSHLLPSHLVAFLQGGVAVALGARSTNGRPIVGAGVACRVRDMTEVCVLLSQSANAALLEAVSSGSAVAATFSRPRDHRSIQLKSPRARICKIAPDDLCEAARQTALLADELIEVGCRRVQAEAHALCGTIDLVALEFRPERLFTQTPGPGAGAELPR